MAGQRAGTLTPAIDRANCEVDAGLSPVTPAAAACLRATDLILSALALAETAVLIYAKLRAQFEKLKAES